MTTLIKTEEEELRDYKELLEENEELKSLVRGFDMWVEQFQPCFMLDPDWYGFNLRVKKFIKKD